MVKLVGICVQNIIGRCFLLVRIIIGIKVVRIPCSAVTAVAGARRRFFTRGGGGTGVGAGGALGSGAADEDELGSGAADEDELGSGAANEDELGSGATDEDELDSGASGSDDEAFWETAAALSSSPEDEGAWLLGSEAPAA